MASMITSVIGYYADEGGPQDYGKEYEFSTKNATLQHLTAFNKSAALVYIQLFDCAKADISGVVPRELPCPAYSAVQWLQLRMKKGIYVRAVTGPGGSTAIGDDDVKFDCGFMRGPVMS